MRALPPAAAAATAAALGAWPPAHQVRNGPHLAKAFAASLGSAAAGQAASMPTTAADTQRVVNIVAYAACTLSAPTTFTKQPASAYSTKCA